MTTLRPSFTFRLNSCRLRTLFTLKSSYRSSISYSTHLSALAASLLLVTTGWRMWGRALYTVSSTILGSIMSIWSWRSL